MIHNRPERLGSRREPVRLRNLHPASTSMQAAEIETRIATAFDDALIKVESDDDTHFGALVVAREFEGLRAIARHQLVYRSLGTLVGNEIHALSIRAYTPAEWSELGGAGYAEFDARRRPSSPRSTGGVRN